MAQSRGCDQSQRRDAFGNPAIKDIPKGMDRSWKTIMSTDCLKDMIDTFKVTEELSIYGADIMAINRYLPIYIYREREREKLVKMYGPQQCQ